MVIRQSVRSTVIRQSACISMVIRQSACISMIIRSAMLSWPRYLDCWINDEFCVVCDGQCQEIVMIMASRGKRRLKGKICSIAVAYWTAFAEIVNSTRILNQHNKM